jgi:hypothetical protein
MRTRSFNSIRTLGLRAVLVAAGGALVFASAFAHAANRPAAETYSATDSSAGSVPLANPDPFPTLTVAQDPVPTPVPVYVPKTNVLTAPLAKPSPQALVAATAKPATPAPPLPIKTAMPPAAPTTAKVNYDAVPIEQTDAFLKRLQLVSELIQKFGRAYDYRVHTVKELETILSDLKQPLDAQRETHADAATLTPTPTQEMSDAERDTGSDSDTTASF